MSIYRFWVLFVPLLFASTLSSCKDDLSKTPPDITDKGHFDGPYILYRDKMVDIVSVVKSSDGSKVNIESYENSKINDMEFTVTPNNGLKTFNFKLFDYANEPCVFTEPGKTLVVSDFEGNFKDFASILMTAGVINADYQWIFANNYLVVNGDFFDRGTDVLPVLWLSYKLDSEARRSGGYVHIILGNHDEMNLRGNVKYVDNRYIDLSQRLGIEYKKLFDENTELGQWLRTKNAMITIGKSLFVHGGISAELIAEGVDIQLINSVVRENLGRNKTTLEGLPKLLWSDFGPFWYRGLVESEEKYNPIQANELDEILNYFTAERIIVGHTVVPEVIGLHGGKVIVVDVDHPENVMNNSSRALLITKNGLKTINDKGEIKPLRLVSSFIE